MSSLKTTPPFAGFLLFALLGISLQTANGVEQIKGDIHVLTITLDQQGNAGGWTQLGANGDWANTVAGTILDGKLYTAESAGGLFVTDLSNGHWQQLGHSDFANTQFMVHAGHQLFTLEKNGNLFAVDPNNGNWHQLGREGDWKNTIAATTYGGHLYTVENSGVLFDTTLPGGVWRQVGKADFGNTQFIFSLEKSLFTIETDGTLYRVSPVDGGWARIGQAGRWKKTVAAATLNNRIYTAESDGNLYCTDPATGSRTNVGRAAFGSTRFMFPTGGLLHTIETSGNLYRVHAKADRTIDEFDCFGEEIDRLFQSQSQGLCHGIHSTNVAGAKATHMAILNAFVELENQAHADDLAVIYLTAHGYTDAQAGWAITTADSKTLFGHEIKAKLGALKCPVLFFLETCECGAFAEAHGRQDPPVPANVTVLCACLPTEVTDNPLDIALAEALYGRADFNHDGVVDLDELIRYVPLRYKEWWPQSGAGTNTPVIVKSKRMPGSLALTHVSKDLAAVAIGEDFWSAIVQEEKDGIYPVHMLGWSSHEGQPYFKTNTAARDQLCLPGDGVPIQVNQANQWRPARIVSHEGPSFHVRYLDASPTEETVPANAIRYPFAGKE